jgi:LysM repeat protein
MCGKLQGGEWVMQWFRIALVAALCAAPLMAGAPRAASAQVGGQNLLTNGNFEGGWNTQAGIGELQVAGGWRAWYVEPSQVPATVRPPSNCNTSDPTCYWMRPEFNAADGTAFPNRVHGGFKAQKYFSHGRMHQAGLLQQVVGVQTGATLRFAIYVQAWQCGNPDACGLNGSRSDAPADMHLRVGIDPYGGTDPFSANVIWSAEKPAFDQWVQFSVEAQAKGTAVTVFTHSRADWDWPRTNNDVYLDDASLTFFEGAIQSATRQPAGAAAPTFTPINTPTPRADGAVAHIVGPSDTLYSLSLQYGVSYDDLLQLNKLSRTSILEIGQILIVKAPPGTATPMPAPSATQTPAPTVTRTPTPRPAVAPISMPTSAPTVAASRASTARSIPILLAVVAAILVAGMTIRRRR